MYIKHLAISHFRNFNEVEEITFPADTLLVAAAPNATGKTNFLEAMAVLLRGKSFRVGLEECVQWGADSFLLQGTVVSRAGEAVIAVRYHQPSRKLRIEEGGIPVSPVTFFSHYPYVLLLPDDIQILTGSPTQRRNFLNQVLVSTPSYLSALVQYHRALKQRNALLKTAKNAEELAAWTALLVEHSQTVWKQRQSLVHFIDAQLNEIYTSITGEELPFRAHLETTTTPEGYQRALEAAFATEQRMGFTLHGPHRDDVVVTYKEHPLYAALSRGQLRSVVIALKIAAWRYIAKTVEEPPLLLMDEVLSELDPSRQATLLQHLPATQTLLTCTSIPSILREQGNVHALDLRSILADVSPTTNVDQSKAAPAVEVTEETQPVAAASVH